MYVKTNWIDDVTPLSATNLNKMEDGIVNDGTWIKIAEQTLVSAVAQVDFASIASGYKNFRITYDLISTGAPSSLLIRLNNDSGTNYRYEKLWGSSSIASAVGTINATSLVLTSVLPPSGAAYAFGVIEISNFNALKAKRIISNNYAESNATPSTSSMQACIVGGAWENTTTEINRISLVASAIQFEIGSRFVLWGCK